MTINWKQCTSYESAVTIRALFTYTNGIENHSIGGKAHKSCFGGHMRKYEAGRISGRYNVGYRHWIEGCLRHGAKLYIGILDNEALQAINDAENYLIAKYPSDMNSKKLVPIELTIMHEGEVPESKINRLAN